MRFLFCLILLGSPIVQWESSLSAQPIQIRIATNLLNPTIQAEIGLNSEQIKAVKEIDTQLKAKIEKLLDELKRVPRSQRERYFKVKFSAINSELKGNLQKILQPKQQKRLTQIGYQQIGHLALIDKAVQSKLRLTIDQKKNLMQLHGLYLRYKDKLTKEAGNDRKKLQLVAKQLKQIRERNLEELIASLTSDQKDHWRDVVGEPFQPTSTPNP